MWVIVEENYGGLYVVSPSGDQDVYDNLARAREVRDDYEVAAVEAGHPVGFRVYELREVS